MMIMHLSATIPGWGGGAGVGGYPGDIRGHDAGFVNFVPGWGDWIAFALL